MTRAASASRRQPRLDAYFGRAVDAEKMAGILAGESRVVVQPDFSIVIIGLNPAPAAELAPFCERTRKGGSPGAIVLKLTRESVVKAVAGGMKPEEIASRLKRRSSNEVPANVLRQVAGLGRLGPPGPRLEPGLDPMPRFRDGRPGRRGPQEAVRTHERDDRRPRHEPD